MRRIFKAGMLLAGSVMFVTLGGLAIAQKTGDAQFARKAATGGMMEVELGKLAVQKASNEKVKQFGQRMIDDHSKAGDDLKGVAAKENITLPTELSPRQKAIVDRFSSMSGTAFDRAYMRDMLRDHQTDVAEFQNEANNGSNADLKSWATTTLPTLQEHLRIAKETETSLGVTSRK